MAWIEQTGTHSWRVRHRQPTGHYTTITGFTGFTDKTTARNYAHDLETDRRRGTWIDPAASHTTLAAWVEQWLPSLDVEIRTCGWRTIPPEPGIIVVTDLMSI